MGWEVREPVDSLDQHVVPEDDLVEHHPNGCVCGPSVEAVKRDDGSVGWVIAFQVSTRRSGLLRIVKVEIHPDGDRFERRYHQLGKAAALLTEVPENYRVDGCCIPRDTWEDRDPRPHQLTMLFRTEALTASLIAHEAVHAAAHIYSIDRYRDHARASAHLTIGNEVIAYLVGDLFSSIARRAQDSGIDLVVGYAQALSDPHGAA